MLIEFVVRLELAVYVIMVQQHRTGARVFGEYEVRLLQYPDGPEGHILEIADGSRNYVQDPCHHLSFLRTAIIRRYTRSESSFQSG